MFWRRKPPPLPASRDPELDELRAQLARRQETAAELEQELFDLQRFAAEVEALLLPLQDRILTLRAQLARATGEYPAAHPARDPRFAAERPERPADTPAPAPAHDETDLKTLYRALAKRFHPDLAADPAEKERRQARMAQVNAAYAARDREALDRLAAEPDPAPAAGAPTRASVVADLRAEIARLDEVIAGLEKLLDELAQSPSVQLKLEVSLARRRGQNLLGEIAAELEGEIARLERALAETRR